MAEFFKHFEFANQWWLLLGLLALACLFLRRRKGSVGTISFPVTELLSGLGQAPKTFVGRLGLFLFVAGLLCAAVALARPRTKDERTFSSASGVDIIVALDVSRSMEAPDMWMEKNKRRAYQATRMEAAKAITADFIARRVNDRIGLVAFSGQPYIASPVTLDHRWLLTTLSRFNTTLIESPGTAIGSAVSSAALRLEKRKDSKSRVIILITDGASNSGRIQPIDAAQAAAKLGIKIYTISIGTPEGRIAGNPDAQFDEKGLKEISKLTHGEHYRAIDTRALENVFSTIDKLEKTEAKKYTVVRYREFFPQCLLATGVFWLLALIFNALKRTPAP